MGKFTDELTREVRLEYMRPEQIDEAKEQMPAIYVPFGAIEWHGYHNVVGLDALKAHEQLVGLALQAGGVVYPPVYFGSGGGHIGWPATYMVNAEAMTQLVVDLLHGFEADGYQKAILISGHYPNRFEYLDAAVTGYLVAGGAMQVLALIENQTPNVGGDHAAKYETSSMLYLHPQTVSWERLHANPESKLGAPDKSINWMGKEYDGHPCYGLFGIDARHASAETGQLSTENLIHYLTNWLDG